MIWAATRRHEKMRDQIREGLKETNKRLNQVLAVLAQDKKV